MLSKKNNLIIYLCFLILSICGDTPRITPKFYKRDGANFVHLPNMGGIKIDKYEILATCYGGRAVSSDIIDSSDKIKVINNELVINFGNIGEDGELDYYIGITTKDGKSSYSDAFFFHLKKKKFVLSKFYKKKLSFVNSS